MVFDFFNMAMSKEFRIKTSVCGILVIGMLISGEVRSQGEKQNDELKFNSIEQYEKRSTVLQIREKLLSEINAKNLRDKTMQSIESRFVAAVRNLKGDDQIIEFINLRRQILELDNDLKESVEQQVELAGMIDNAMAAGGLLPQVQGYLNEARTQLRSMGVSQEALKKKLATSMKQLNMAMNNVPPPASFKTSGGIEFKLVSAGANSFYISASPLGEDTTLEEAYKASLALSEKEGSVFMLPGMAELKILSQLNMNPPKAVWSSHVWTNDDTENARMSERFGVKFYMIWDPANMLGRGVTFGELPFARHPQVAYYLVTSRRTGLQYRWNRIISSMK